MSQKDIAIVFDCGATNLRVIAMDTTGNIVASHSMSNQTDEDPYMPGGRIWDVEKLWGKFCAASKKVVAAIDPRRIAGATVTTFGVDGTFINAEGDMLYPVISWQCSRTSPIMQNIDKYIPLEKLYAISGVFPYPFNTISKMIWFKENKPDVINKAKQFLFLPSLFLMKMGGRGVNDATMMGTSMMADLEARDFSEYILSTLELSPGLFGSPGEPGESVGQIDKQGSETTGLPMDTPLFLTGHDTQFAIFGSGAESRQPVLSSGTWEILMARSKSFTASPVELANGLTTEADAERGLYTIGQNWLGSGVLEWFSRNFYPELSGDQLYETMIREAEEIEPGAHNLDVNPAFMVDGNQKGGTIHGLTLHTTRAEIYRAFLESLAFRLRQGLETLQTAGGFKAERIICVGGGSKNPLWNQLRADVCNIPVQVVDHKETTVLGAALFVFAGAGKYRNASEAREHVNYNARLVEPSANAALYEGLYKQSGIVQ